MLARRLQGLLALGDRDLQRDDAVGAFFRATADAFVALGLRDAGYRHLQIDDCWMTAARGARGEQLVDASKFPDGMSNLTAHLRGAGFKAGIYTATGNRTCAERAGSCGAFGVDTAQYAAWGFEYLKVDSCGGCSGGPMADTAALHAGLDNATAAGRGQPFWLLVHPSTNVSAVSADPARYGNSRIPGRDMFESRTSLVAAVDGAAGLWRYAHNDTAASGASRTSSMCWSEWATSRQTSIESGASSTCARS